MIVFSESESSQKTTAASAQDTRTADYMDEIPMSQQSQPLNPFIPLFIFYFWGWAAQSRGFTYDGGERNKPRLLFPQVGVTHVIQINVGHTNLDLMSNPRSAAGTIEAGDLSSNQLHVPTPQEIEKQNTASASASPVADLCLLWTYTCCRHRRVGTRAIRVMHACPVVNSIAQPRRAPRLYTYSLY